MIQIRGLTKKYGDKTAVDNLSLDLPPGEVFAFLGPNGAGKTTTLKILAGLVRPTQGTAHIGGHDIVSDGLAARMLLSYVPDEPYLYEKLTGREFLRMVGDLYGMPRGRAADRIESLADRFELRDFIDDLCESYSHGMKQRVVIAAALLHEPKALVIDEPTVGLDPRSTRTLKDTLSDLAHTRGVTVMMSTHTLSIAEELADRIGILSLGRLVALGTLKELRQLQTHRGGTGHQRLEDLFLDLTGGGNGNGSASSVPAADPNP
jgi:ABC-2 type transport system ATP-binding protein